MDLEIRAEQPPDYDAIHQLTETAFAPMPYSDGTEAECIRKLRADGDLTLSFVALDAGHIVGHIAFSPVTIEGVSSDWYGLGPVSAQPDRQKTGIGSALINHGLDRLKAIGAKGCVLIGDPNYYCRFGFVGDGRLSYRDLPDEVVQWLAFTDERPAGTLKFSTGLE